jgi:hypothetical protein
MVSDQTTEVNIAQFVPQLRTQVKRAMCHQNGNADKRP